jgi:DNA processing protein
MEQETQLVYQIALTLLPDVGPVSQKRLIAFCGNVEDIFREKKKFLLRIPGIHRKMVDSIINQQVLDRATEEVAFIQRNKVRPLFYLSPHYPERLKHCADSPVMLYFKGECDLNPSRVIAVVGTRRPSRYGLQQCEALMEGLAGYGVLVVSGLAYGIDACAHQQALRSALPTVGVLAHGLDRIYPPVHRKMASSMMERGGLLTDYLNGTNPDRQNFPSRNRIVAGMVDAVVVIESGPKGGALITADIANSYSRDVFAIPGRNTDPASEGCNLLINNNKAGILLGAAHLAKMMGWDDEKPVKQRQRELFIDLTEEEEQIVMVVKEHNEPVIDKVSLLSGLTVSRTAALLLGLELKGIVRCLPGKKYDLC